MPLPRLHFFEFSDLPWFTGVWRDMFQDYLCLIHRVVNPYRQLVPELKRWAERTKGQEVLDLCSGGGGHVLSLHEASNSNLVTFCLSDLFPQVEKYKQVQEKLGADKVHFISHPVSAFAVPQELAQMPRSIFTAFHHFAPKDAARIITDALAKGDGIFIAEFFERRLSPILLMPFGLFAIPLLPFMGKFSLKRLFLAPLVALIGIFDGVISVLRTYTLDEILEMIPAATKDELTIEYKLLPYLPGTRAYYVAITKKAPG